MIRRRDVAIAVASITTTWAAFQFAHSADAVVGSSAFEWNSMPVKDTDVGQLRSVLRSPTATLNELEIHVTTLKPGVSSHAPHKHPNEELVIIKQGTLEALVNGEYKRVGPGSIIFNASNQLHSIRNVGDGPATYHVIEPNSESLVSRVGVLMDRRETIVARLEAVSSGKPRSFLAGHPSANPCNLLIIDWDGTDFVHDVVTPPLEYARYTAVVAPSPERNPSPSRPQGILS
jgi:XRE family transcriptional regulator, regulator of sulfur utilization